MAPIPALIFQRLVSLTKGFTLQCRLMLYATLYREYYSTDYTTYRIPQYTYSTEHTTLRPAENRLKYDNDEQRFGPPAPRPFAFR
eukprot:4275256-Prymnesium_polylepis.2